MESRWGSSTFNRYLCWKVQLAAFSQRGKVKTLASGHTLRALGELLILPKAGYRWGGGISHLIMSPRWFRLKWSITYMGRTKPSGRENPRIPGFWGPNHYARHICSSICSCTVHSFLKPTELRQVPEISHLDQHLFQSDTTLASLWIGAVSSVIESTNLYWSLLSPRLCPGSGDNCSLHPQRASSPVGERKKIEKTQMEFAVEEV